MSDIDTVLVDRLKALDPNRPIREADIGVSLDHFVSRQKNAVRYGDTKRFGRFEIDH